MIPRQIGQLDDLSGLGVLVSILQLGSWATLTDLAEALEADPGTLMGHVRRMSSGAERRIVRDPVAPGSQDQLKFLKQEGMVIPGTARPDPARRLTLEAMREALGAGPANPPRRAWLVRLPGNAVPNLLEDWLAGGYCGIEAARLQQLTAEAGDEEVDRAVRTGYAHLAQVAIGDKTTEIQLFLKRVSIGDLMATPSEDGEQLYIGEVTSAAHFTSDQSAGLRRSVRWLNTERPVDLFEDDIPDGLNGKLGVQLSVVDLTDLVESIEALLPATAGDPPPPRRSLHLPDATQQLAAELHIRFEDLDDWLHLLRDRPQIVFYGPPGTGKTYLARKLALHLTGGRRDRVTLVQFHPSYAYEDFFEGFRPRQAKDGQPGFELVPGPFRRTVENARKDPAVPHVLIIDEVNRANLARVFGELYFLLEYRDEVVHLQYGTDEGNGFSLPRNVVILGTMNTVDRSVARVDAAMRRRFAFVELHPSEEPTASMLRKWLHGNGLPEEAADLLDELNSRISDRSFQLGPSYLMRRHLYEQPGALARTWRTSILPLLADQHLDETGIQERFGLTALLTDLGLDEQSLLTRAEALAGSEAEGPAA
ncbi:McrB family protein [Kitasatospora sp. NPDC051705]|uniref:McrB family protein n=1 Tax=Kitasatospora sp. NPDC051705 TaxID=3364057 RepID=UPI00378A2A12